MSIDNPTTSGPGVVATQINGPVPPAVTPQWPLLVAICVLAIGAMGAVGAITLRGGETSTPVVISILGFATATIASMLALVKVNQVGSQMTALHLDVNSRLTQLIAASSEAAKAQGQLQGAEDQRIVTDARTIAQAVALATLEQDHRAADAQNKHVPQDVHLVGTDNPVPVVIAPPRD